MAVEWCSGEYIYLVVTVCCFYLLLPALFIHLYYSSVFYVPKTPLPHRPCLPLRSPVYFSFFCSPFIWRSVWGGEGRGGYILPHERYNSAFQVLHYPSCTVLSPLPEPPSIPYLFHHSPSLSPRPPHDTPRS